ncbi:MAG TPA: glycoside hydrolase family 28 protein, partial [Gemmatimonadaceae bacterium]|nr:glycoside hydrolase family 28 protein [Gemmatimonadaceae bacterium]
ATGWDLVPGILMRIVPPRFPGRDFDVARFGAVGNGVVDCTDAIRSAIDECVRAGGGRVVIPEGRFLTGAIRLQSNVNLHVKKGAILAFSTNASQYLPIVLTRFEGVEVMNYSPLIYAFECTNVAVTGEGTLDGQADNEHWWPWKGAAAFGWKTGAPRQNEARQKLFDMAEKGVDPSQRVFGDGGFLRPSFIEPYRCRNVLIEGVTILNSPMWEVHPVLCENVTVRDVHITSLGPNNDGCDPESCTDVLIENCFFNTGDDCIAIKSGRNADGRRIAKPSQNIIIRGCEMRDGHGGVTIGSEISGGVRNVFAERCTMDSPHLDRVLRLKNNAARGGLLEHIYMRDVTVGQVAESVLAIDLLYEEGANGKFMPVVRDVEMRNVTTKKSDYGVYIRGFDGSEISGVRVIDCTFDNVAKGNVIEHASAVELRNVRINGTVVA